MFSEMIQSMLNSGGRSVAMKRAAQINNYVNSTNKTQNVPNTNNLNTIYPPDKNSVQSFEKILSKTKQSDFGTLLLNPSSLNVNANIYGNSSSSSSIENISSDNAINATLLRALKEVEDAKQDFSKPATNNKAQLINMINKVARDNGVDEKLVQALIKQESGFNTKAKSKAGAMGLMQLMPATAKAMGVKDPYNATQNVEGGVRYLKSLLNKYNGNIILSLAAYNAGPAAVDKYDGVPPYKETQNYVKNILANYL